MDVKNEVIIKELKSKATKHYVAYRYYHKRIELDKCSDQYVIDAELKHKIAYNDCVTKLKKLDSTCSFDEV